MGLLGSTTMPFITYVVPGILYYYHLDHQVDGSSKIARVGCLVFASLGFLFILAYTALSIERLDKMNEELLFEARKDRLPFKDD